MDTCRARLLSDLSGQTACDKPATSADGRLCAFHSRQCQGKLKPSRKACSSPDAIIALYRGYKKRNAELDKLSEALPPYLKASKTSIVVQDFKDVDDEATLRELHDYLFRKYNLIEKVIRGRKLHHSHFFAIDNDYGHEKYLTKLQSEKHVMARALERLGKRGADINHQDTVCKPDLRIQWLDETLAMHHLRHFTSYIKSHCRYLTIRTYYTY